MSTIRGGGVWNSARICHSAYRGAIDLGRRGEDIGFRTKVCAPIVVRGGSWLDLVQNCRAAYRSRYGPGNRRVSLGFRTKTT